MRNRTRVTQCLLITIVFVDIIILALYFKYTNGRIFKQERKTKGNLGQNFSTSLQVNRTSAFEETSTELALLKNIRTQCSQLSFSFVSHTTQPRFEEKSASQNLFLLVLIPSGFENVNRERRSGIRRTWGNQIGQQTSRLWKRVFVLGSTHNSELYKHIMQESSTFNDILALDVIDNYENLVIKSYSSLLWGLAYVNPRFILKADDDVYVRIPYLITWLESYATDRFYGGSVIRGGKVRRSARDKNRVAEDCRSVEDYPAYCSGPFYVLSSNAIRLIFKSMQKWKAIPPEDAYMGVLSHESGLVPVDIPGFEPFRGLRTYGKCNWASAVALGHGFGQFQFSYVENKLQEHSDLPRYYYQCLVTEWAGSIFLFAILSAVIVLALTLKKFRSWLAPHSRNSALRLK